MIINLFRQTQFISIFIILIASFSFWSVIFFKEADLSNHIEYLPIMFIDKIISYNIYIQRLILGIIIFWQSIYITKIIVDQKIISINTFYPALFYFLTISCFPEAIIFSPILISICLLLISIKKLFSIYLNKDSFLNIFESALMIGVASIIHPPFIIFTPIIWVGMYIFSQTNWRQYILSFLGILIPWVIFFTFSFSSNLDKNILSNILKYFKLKQEYISIDFGDILTFGILSILVLLSFKELIFSLKKKNIKARKSYTLFIWIFIFTLIFLKTNLNHILENITCLAIPISTITSNYFYYNKNSIWLNTLIAIFLICIFLNHFII